MHMPYNVYGREVVQMSRTNIVLDDKLVTKCQRATGIKTRRALVQYALEELLRQKNQKRILELEGTVHWEGDLDACAKGGSEHGSGQRFGLDRLLRRPRDARGSS